MFEDAGKKISDALKAELGLDQPDQPSKQDKKQSVFYTKAPKTINMRIDPYQFQQIKQHAMMEGLRYQTFIKSVVFRYINGLLVPRPKKHREGY
jgi:predicted DNA binding CopG/RHH family protein